MTSIITKVGIWLKKLKQRDVIRILRSKFGPMSSFTVVDINDEKADVIVTEGPPDDSIYPTVVHSKAVKIGINWRFPFDKRCFAYDHIFTPDISHTRELQTTIGTYKAHYMPDLSLFTDKKYGEGVAVCCDFSCSDSKVDEKKYSDDIMGITDALIRMCQNLIKYHKIYLYAYTTGGKTILNKIKDSVRLSLIPSQKSNGPFDISDYTSTDEDDISPVDVKSFPTHRRVRSSPLSAPLLTLASKNEDTQYREKSPAYFFDFSVCCDYSSLIYSIASLKPFIFIATNEEMVSLAEELEIQNSTFYAHINGVTGKLYIPYGFYKSKITDVISTGGDPSSGVNKFRSKIRYHIRHNQIGNLINSALLSKYRTVDCIYDEVQQYVKSCGEITYEVSDVVARLITYRVTGTLDSEFVHGARENFMNYPHKLRDQIEWLLQEVPTIPPTEISKGDGKDQWNITTRSYSQYKGLHRSGWYPVVKQLAQTANDYGLIFDAYVDNIHWCKNIMRHIGTLPRTSPWIGFIHHHYHDNNYSDYNTELLFNTEDFIQSLFACGAIFTLSDILTRKIRERLEELNYSNIPVITFVHPTDTEVPMFNLGKCLEKRNIVQVGSWLRKPFSIWELETKWNKYALKGRKMENYFPPKSFKLSPLSDLKNPAPSGTVISPEHDPECLSRGCATNMWMSGLTKYLGGVYYGGDTLYVSDVTASKDSLEKIYPTVKIIEFLNDKDYDSLLTESVVFLDFACDVAACNTIVECIVRKTPMILTRQKGTVSLLGDKYPLFFDKLEDIPGLMSENNIRLAHEYLIQMSKDVFDINKFISNIRDVIVSLNIA